MYQEEYKVHSLIDAMSESDQLEHHGIKGMKWGIRRTPEQLGHKKYRHGKVKIGNYKLDAISKDRIKDLKRAFKIEFGIQNKLKTFRDGYTDNEAYRKRYFERVPEVAKAEQIAYKSAKKCKAFKKDYSEESKLTYKQKRAYNKKYYQLTDRHFKLCEALADKLLGDDASYKIEYKTRFGNRNIKHWTTLSMELSSYLYFTSFDQVEKWG